MMSTVASAQVLGWSDAFAELAGRVVLVTGASSGIGAAVARGFAACGARVVVHYHAGEEAARSLADEIGAGALVEAADLSRPGEAPRLVARVAERAGRLDVVVNNAGALFGRVPFGEISDGLFRQLIDLNVTSVFEACRAALPIFRGQQSGCVINTTSIAARNGGGPGTVAYATSKGAVSTLTRGLAREWAPENFRVNAVAPGIIATPLHDRHTPPDVLETLRQSIPMRRLGTPDDCVGAFLFLACERLSCFVTGQVIEVNGGQLTP
jgi:3-oxoacyl-[acyl-carrier protein] reductase